MKVIVAGGTGLVGSALVKRYLRGGHQVVSINSKNLNLLDRKSTFEFIRISKPDLIVDAAAKVGGINYNSRFPVEFLSNNLQIQCNLMDAALASKVDRFIFLGSSCIYPRNCPQPIREEYLMTGPLEPSNSAYAVAKIAGIEAVKAARNEYGFNWISLMPTNVYGPYDNFNLEEAHVLPALIRKFIDAQERNTKEVTLWGDGTVYREFIHSDDLADAIHFADLNYNENMHLNIGTGVDLTVKELAEKIAGLVEYNGKIVWDDSKPKGTPKKLLDVSRISSLGWAPSINLNDGILDTINWYKKALSQGAVRL